MTAKQKITMRNGKSIRVLAPIARLLVSAGRAKFAEDAAPPAAAPAPSVALLEAAPRDPEPADPPPAPERAQPVDEPAEQQQGAEPGPADDDDDGDSDQPAKPKRKYKRRDMEAETRAVITPESDK